MLAGLMAFISMLVCEWLGKSMICSAVQPSPASRSTSAGFNVGGKPTMSTVTSANFFWPSVSTSALAKMRSWTPSAGRFIRSP